MHAGHASKDPSRQSSKQGSVCVFVFEKGGCSCHTCQNAAAVHCFTQGPAGRQTDPFCMRLVLMLSFKQQLAATAADHPVHTPLTARAYALLMAC